jgi:hypothetical protein
MKETAGRGEQPSTRRFKPKSQYAYVETSSILSIPAEEPQMSKLEPTPELVRLIETIVDQRLAALMRGPLATPVPVQRFMSGRWHRRDGDGYGIFPRPGEHHADHPPGNLRPSDQR